MNIQLISTKAISVDLEPFEDSFEEKTEDDTSFSFDFNPIIEEQEKPNRFLVAFFVELKNFKEQYDCKVIYVAKFEVDETISNEFLKENFALINAPAIGYPYFRAFYSNFLLNAGYEPKILPTINFVQLRTDKLEEINKRSE